MDPGQPDDSRTHLQWTNVGLGLAFVAFDAILSGTFQLGVGRALLTAAVRCIIQLAVMALVLQKIFETNNPWGVAGLALLLNLLGTTEIVVNKTKRRFTHMYPIILCSLLCSTIPVSILGSRFAMDVEPFWTPDQYIPIVGMLCGATISGVVIAQNYLLKEIHENRDKIEMYLTFGATRMEACRPVAQETLRLALTPPINQMSVLGIISIPGMMTGAILGGSSVAQAARLQMVIMFMIAAATALASIISTGLAMMVVVDAEHRIRVDLIDSRVHAIWRARDRAVAGIEGKVEIVWASIKKMCVGSQAESGERERRVV